MGEKAIFLSICLWLPVTASGIIPLQTRVGTTSTLPLSKNDSVHDNSIHDYCDTISASNSNKGIDSSDTASVSS